MQRRPFDHAVSAIQCPVAECLTPVDEVSRRDDFRYDNASKIRLPPEIYRNLSHHCGIEVIGLWQKLETMDLTEGDVCQRKVYAALPGLCKRFGRGKA